MCWKIKVLQGRENFKGKGNKSVQYKIQGKIANIEMVGPRSDEGVVTCRSRASGSRRTGLPSTAGASHSMKVERSSRRLVLETEAKNSSTGPSRKAVCSDEPRF